MLWLFSLGSTALVISVSGPKREVTYEYCYTDKYIAEDVVDASRRIPKALLWSTTANKVSCLICAILICLCAGDVALLFTGPLGASGHPLGAIVQLTYNAARENKALASAPFGMIAPIL